MKELTKLNKEEIMADLLAAMERNEKELYAMNKKRFDEMLFAWDALKSLLLK